MVDNLLEQNNDQTNARAEIIAKWKDKPREELEAAKAESDLYIKTLERQKDELRNDYLKLREEANAQAKLQELIDRIEKTSSSTNVTTTQVNELENQPKYDPKEVKSLVSETLRQEKLEEVMNNNFNSVRSKLVEHFGDNFQSSLQAHMSALGLTGDELNEMARTRPNVLIKALGLDQPVQKDIFQSPIRSSQRNEPFAPRNEKRTWSYYQKMKRDNPKLYFDKKTQFQMHQDSGALGAAFEDGDFNAL